MNTDTRFSLLKSQSTEVWAHVCYFQCIKNVINSISFHFFSWKSQFSLQITATLGWAPDISNPSVSNLSESAAPGSTLSSPSSGTVLIQLQQDLTRWYTCKLPEPRQLVPLESVQQHLSQTVEHLRGPLIYRRLVQSITLTLLFATHYYLPWCCTKSSVLNIAWMFEVHYSRTVSVATQACNCQNSFLWALSSMSKLLRWEIT